MISNDDCGPLKVDLVDPSCISAFLQPFTEFTFEYLSLLEEGKELVGNTRLCVVGYGALV